MNDKEVERRYFEIWVPRGFVSMNPVRSVPEKLLAKWMGLFQLNAQKKIFR